LCGIAGRVGTDCGTGAILTRMVDTLVHRGPDAQGEFRIPGVELGIRRLSIVDVAHGNQPIVLDHANLAMVFNGEIFNFRQLRTRLESIGYGFSTDSDSEVAAVAYQAWGSEAFKEFEGMFAIALWDGQRKKLLLARDELGKKPLLYRRRPGGGLDFASEVRALRLAASAVHESMSVSFEALDRVLAFGYIGTPLSAYAEVEQVAPGTLLEWSMDGGITHSSWAAPMSTRPLSGSPTEIVDECQKLIEDAVSRRLVSERPIGALLSGGIDSTITTALMVRSHTERVSTFSIGFENPEYDESSYARAVAQWLGTDHHELIVKPDPERWVQTLGDAFDEPFADSSAIPTLLVSEFAAQSVVVALTGDGGDEVFGGYRRYSAVPALQRINPLLALTSSLREPLAQVASRAGRRRLSRLALEMRPAPSLMERYMRVMALTDPTLRSRLWSPDVSENLTFSRPSAEHWFEMNWASSQRPYDSPSQHLAAMDLVTYLPGDLLVKADISSMAHSLELRSPLLDRDVVEFGLSLPQHLRHFRGQDKYLLRQVAAGLVPAKLIDRPKMGFGVPKAAWLRGPLNGLMHDLLLDSVSRSRGWFQPEVVASLISDHESGTNRDDVLWALMMIEVWARRWLDPS